MKAVPFSVKGYIQAENSKGLAPLGLRYTASGKVSAVTLSRSVTAKNFDSKTGLMLSKDKDSVAINALIRLRSQLLEQAANSAVSFAFVDVKPVYLALVAEHERDQHNADFNTKLELVQDWARVETAVEEQEAARETIKRATKTLKKLSKKGVKVETAETKEFEEMLDEYPSRFIVKNTAAKGQQAIKSFIKRLQRFGEETGYMLTFSNMNSEFYEKFGKWMCHGPIDAYDNYFGKNISYLKTFLKWCEEKHNKKVCSDYREFKILKEEKDIFYLDDHELALLEQYKENPDCPTFWIKYIDFTLFQALTGLRYSDCARSRWKVEDGFLRGTAKKNKGNYNVPLDLDERILAILNKYGFNMHLFAEQNYNDEIKKIMRAVYEHNGVYSISEDDDAQERSGKRKIEPRDTSKKRNPNKQIYFRSKLGEEIEFEDYKHNLLSSHCNRRSFCSRAGKAGFGEKEILTMLGSRSMIELKKYIKIEDSSLKEKAKRIAALKVQQDT